MNVQKESLKKLPGFTQAPASPRKKCAMKMKERKYKKKTTAVSKKFLWKEGFYKAVSEDCMAEPISTNFRLLILQTMKVLILE